MTIPEAYIDFTEKLKTIYEDREAENIADWIFENATGLKRWERRENKNQELNETDSEKLKKYLKELLKHKPVQYVLNEAWFYKRKFFVDENVLIPRPETEELVEWILHDANLHHSKPTLPTGRQVNILDIGTGSGCIAVSLKKELPYAKVAAIDIQEKALGIAKKNAFQISTSIDFFQIDFLKEAEWNQLKKYDIIVSNPPYIPVKEKNFLAKNVTEFEPAIALFVENNDPFIFYRMIANFAKIHLNKSGKIYVEVHENYARQIKRIFENKGFNAEIRRDMYGNERMIKAD